jgi:hypothetical protein
LSDEPDADVLGHIDYSFGGSFGSLNTQEKDQLVYLRLLRVAKQRYAGNVDIREISWQYRPDGTNMTAKGTVIMAGNVGPALERASEEIMSLLQSSSKIAIVLFHQTIKILMSL